MTHADLEDYLGIHTLYGRYNWHLDIGDTDGMLALFLPGGSITQPGPDGPVVARGPEGVRRVVEGWHATPEQRGRQHQVTNLVVDADSQGRADHRTARTYFLVTDGAGAPPSQLIWCGYSDDIVVKTEDGWRFLHRFVGVWGPESAAEYKHQLV